jgi:predicted outer membrane repeat protein
VTGNGGAILNAGTLDLIYVWVKDSDATAQGGGLASSGTVRIISSVFSGNAAGDNGGGVITQGGAMTVVNSTFTENEAVNHGGALYGTGGTLAVRFSTISDNLADSNAGGLGDGGAIRWESSGTATVEHSILAGNTDLSPAFWVSTHPDISGAFISGGYNLIGIRDGATGFTNGVNNDQVGTVAAPINPLLGTLTNHGGPVPTMALNLISPAVNRGNPLFNPLLQPAPFDSYLIYDNRGPGFARVVNERLDLGAFELEEPEIVVKRADTSSIPNGTGTYDFGTVEAGANGTAVFTVSNMGTGELQLTEPIQLPSGVSLVSTFGTTTLAAGQSTTFTVHLDTAAPHAISGTIQFGNNDADEGTFAFGLTGQVVDTTAPSAALTPLANITTTGVSQLIIDVTFNDIVGVNIGSIGTTDISVSGPVAGFPASPTSVTILDENGLPVATNGPARKARFTFNVPTASGKFGWRDNGTYTINLVNGSVADTTGNSVIGGALGSFQVNVPRPFALWQQRYFNNGAGGLLPNSGAEDDADQDGLPNAYEYLFGSNPNDAQSTPNFDGWFFYQDTFDNYDLKFSFAYPLYKDDMSVEFQVSDDLITWRTAVVNTDYEVEQDAVFNGFDAEYFPNQHVTVQKRDVRYQIITSRSDGQRQAHFRLKLRLELP